MAKPTRKRRVARRGNPLTRSLGDAQSAIGGYVSSGRKYVSSGSRQATDTIGSFLASFDTSELIAALKHKAQAAVGAGPGTRRKRKPSATRRSAPKVRRAASRKKTTTRRSARRK